MKTSRPICQHFVKCLCSAVLMVQLRETRVVDSAVVVWGGGGLHQGKLRSSF